MKFDFEREVKIFNFFEIERQSHVGSHELQGLQIIMAKSLSSLFLLPPAPEAASSLAQNSWGGPPTPPSNT